MRETPTLEYVLLEKVQAFSMPLLPGRGGQLTSAQDRIVFWAVVERARRMSRRKGGAGDMVEVERGR